MKPDLAKLFLILIVGTFSGCASLDGNETESMPKAKGYRVSAPDSWKTRSRSESDEAYQTPSGAVVTLTSSCGRNSEASLEILLRNLLIGARRIQYKEKEKIQIGNTPGLFANLVAHYDKIPMNLELFVSSQGGCVFDFSMISNKPFTQEDRTQFRTYFTSFKNGKN